MIAHDEMHFAFIAFDHIKLSQQALFGCFTVGLAFCGKTSRNSKF